jgi:hypothetical protein
LSQESAGASVVPGPFSLSTCSALLPDGTIFAQGTGTIDGRDAVVILVQPPGSQPEFDAVLADPCEVRHLP